jgi:hypothetical protein
VAPFLPGERERSCIGLLPGANRRDPGPDAREGWLSPSRRSALAETSRADDPALILRQLLNPIRRHVVPGIPRGYVVAGVWPEGRGFTARLDAIRRPGVPGVWARWREGLEVWPFPRDPQLAALPELLARGDLLVGHRLGRKATFASADGTHFLQLRSARSSAITLARSVAVHAALERQGVHCASIAADDRLPAIRSERVADSPPVDGAIAPAMGRLGETLARAHAASPPSGLPARGPGRELDATVRQVALAGHSRTTFTQWLERRLDRWKLLSPVVPHGTARVHGSLRLRHVARADPPVILDWHGAGPGDPEEDLGALAADLYWLRGSSARFEFAAFRSGYRQAGGGVDQPRFESYARLSLVRRLATQAMNEMDQRALRARSEEWSAWPEVVAGW